MFNVFSKKVKKLPEPGSVWIEKNADPFDKSNSIRVLDVKANSSGKYFVQYTFLSSEGITDNKYSTSLDFLHYKFSPLV